MKKPTIIIIAAVANNGVIGNQGQMPWVQKADLRRFKGITSGACVVMGRKTFYSIGRLKNRVNIVMTKDEAFPPRDDVEVVYDFVIAKRIAAYLRKDLFVIGGAEIFKEALPEADFIHLTEIDCDPEGDTFFPDIPSDGFEEIYREFVPKNEENQYDMTYVDLKRVKNDLYY